MNKGQKTLVVGAILLIGLLAISIFLLHSNSKSNHPAGEYYDPFSHETVSNPPGKGPDTFGSSQNQPVYLGFDKLLDHGLSFDQLGILKNAFLRYSQSRPQPLEEISIDVDNITTRYNSADPNAHYFIFFNVRFDRKNTYKAKVEYAGLNDIRLYLTAPSTGKVFFDSQVIGSELN